MAPESHPTLELRLSAQVATASSTSDGALHVLVLSLFDECHAGLLRYVQAFGLETEAAEDVVQDVFLALFQHLRRGRPRDHLRGWLFQVAHNLALRERRRRRRGSWVAACDDAHLERIADGHASPEDALAEADEVRRVRDALRVLTRRDRQCLYLRAEGLRYRDIARVLGMSLGGVAKSLARALGHLSSDDGR